jgi:phosphohistidine phosphatase
MRTIWVIRHGKSAAGESGQSDFDRPLNHRGLADGPLMEGWLAEQQAPATWVWCSPAARAKATAAFVGRGFGAEVVEEPSLYLASADTLLGCLRETPPDIASAAIVAHNPGLTSLVNLLGDHDVTSNLVTFGTARFSFDGEWADLRFGIADFVDLQTPKTI